MKISELIDDLKDVQDKYGDVEICVKNEFTWGEDEIVGVFYEDECSYILTD
nr:hypothetical protein [uncultured Cellulosilyticum sp.]